MRVAVGGFQHETNTFAPEKASFDRFERADGWPALCRAETLLPGVDGINIPITGAVEALTDAGHDLVPLLWCSATPSAHVTEDAFERISAMFLDDLAKAGPLDGIYLDLHGAMVCEHLEDGEGELLARIRKLVGPDVPIAVSLDLHANVTAEMVRHASVIDIYRTYPHIDMAETGSRAALHLDRLMKGDGPWYVALRRTDYLIPLNWGCSLLDPAKTLYDDTLPGILAGSDDIRALSFACGFSLADIAEVGPAVVAYGKTLTAAEAAADAMIASVEATESAFAGEILEPRAAVRRAVELSLDASGPVVISDTQDNPGGGGAGDTTGLLRAMIDEGAKGAVLGMMIDAQAAKTAHEAGEGSDIEIGLGGRSFAGDTPLFARYRVLRIGDGNFMATGPMWGGSRMQLGPMALLETGGVKVVVASKPMQCGDTSMFRHLGVEPTECRIIGVKSSVHFRADFQPIADTILVTEAPGPVFADPSKLTFSNIRRGVRLKPRGK